MKISELKLAIVEFLCSVVGYIVFVPISLIVPKRPNRIVFIGRHNGLFIDNVKHVFLYASEQKGVDARLLVYSKQSAETLSEYGLQVLEYPTIKSICSLLTASHVVVDSAEWIATGKFHFSAGSRVIQLWHGVPLKQIELPLYQERLQRMPFLLQPLLRLYKALSGRYAKTGAVVSTSDFVTDEIFAKQFNTREFLQCGYPRNDAILDFADVRDPTDSRFINTDLATIELLEARKKDGLRLLLYAPTFRRNHGTPFDEKVLSIEALNKFAVEKNLVIVFKLHPVLSAATDTSKYSNLETYNSQCDIYPALGLFDALITDYSSIFFDYLLLDRPIVFFPYDLKRYLDEDRPLIFDYSEFVPGTICTDQDTLCNAILTVFNDTENSEQGIKRQQLRDLVFAHADSGSRTRLWQSLHL